MRPTRSFHITFILLPVFLLFIPEASAQFILKGVVYDEQHIGIEGVNVSYFENGKAIGTATTSNGNYRITVPSASMVSITFSHIAFRDTTVVIKPKKRSTTLNIVLHDKIRNISPVIIQEESPYGTQRDDTTVFYANAYKVSDDATAYDMVTSKLPGVNITENGIEVQGEVLSNVLVNGKTYYNNDIVLALKSLPAEIINEIQIFDQGSDHARLLGYNDPDKKRVLNIVTNQADSTRIVAKAYGGYGSDSRYNTYGNLSLMNSTQNISIFAQLNNINKQDFSILSLPSGQGETPGPSPYSKGKNENGFMQDGNMSENMSSSISDGINTTQAFGVNYSYKPSSGKITIAGDYLFNKNNNFTTYKITDLYFTSDKDTVQNWQTQKLQSSARNHRINSLIEYHPGASNAILLKPVFAYHTGHTGGIIDITPSGQESLCKQNTQTDETQILSMADISYVHNFRKVGHSIGLNIKLAHQEERDSSWLSVYQPQNNTELHKNTATYESNNNLNANLSYILPINRASKLKFDAGGGLYTGENTIHTEQQDSLGIFRPEFKMSGQVGTTNTGYDIGASYCYTKFGLDLTSGVQWRQTKQVILWGESDNSATYGKFLPFLSAKYIANTKNQMHLRYSSRLVFPALSKLQEAVRIIDPLLSFYGNRRLEPSYKHISSFRWVHNGPESSNIFVLFGKWEYEINPVTTSRQLDFTTIGTPNQSQIVTYRNSNQAASSLHLLTAYGFPFRTIKANVNISSLIALSSVPGYYNNLLTTGRGLDWSNSLTVGSNISKNLDFVVDLNVKYISDQNDLFPQIAVRYWSYSYGGQIKAKPTKWLRTSFECGHTGYSGLNSSRYDATICNAAISVLLGPKQAWEVQFSVNDLFNQNNSFQYLTTEVYRRESESNVLGRYFLLTCIYTINHINK